MNGIARRLAELKQSIAEWEREYGRDAGSVFLLAVSKGHDVSALRAALAAGQRAFGESYLQEALAKIEQLRDERIEWHFIGRLQSNKTRAVAANFDWVHSIDRPRIAQRLSAQRPAGSAPLNCCIEVRLDDEESKAGVSGHALSALAEQVEQLPGLRLRGLMAIPAPRTDFAAQRRVFARLRGCYTALRGSHPHMDTLSMGMSADLEAAIAEGTSLVRVGTAIFGPRPSKSR